MHQEPEPVCIRQKRIFVVEATGTYEVVDSLRHSATGVLVVVDANA